MLAFVIQPIIFPYPPLNGDDFKGSDDYLTQEQQSEILGDDKHSLNSNDHQHHDHHNDDSDHEDHKSHCQ
jgi:hypothetical protein